METKEQVERILNIVLEKSKYQESKAKCLHSLEMIKNVMNKGHEDFSYFYELRTAIKDMNGLFQVGLTEDTTNTALLPSSFFLDYINLLFGVEKVLNENITSMENFENIWTYIIKDEDGEDSKEEEQENEQKSE